jgi:hypothetical protein
VSHSAFGFKPPCRRCAQVRSTKTFLLWRPDGAQHLQHATVALTLGFRDCLCVRCHLTRCRISNLRNADVDRDLLGEASRVEHAERRPPGMAEHHDFVLPEAAAHEIHELV